MAEVTLGSLAELLAVHACSTRRDLRAEAARCSWGGAWRELSLNQYLDEPSAADPGLTYRQRIERMFGGAHVPDLSAIDDLISRSWSPPCPPNGTLNVMFEAAAAAHGLNP